jgi:glycosyltransferase involved in cell wall biosynthesis
MRVSIIMPVRNAAGFVRDAVDSILAQSFKEWELLVIDDQSDDDSAAIVAAYDDPRIRLVCPGERLHFAGSLNHGIREAAGDLVARMDADDVSLPHRLAEQVAFLDANPNVALCGTWARTFGLGKSTQLRPPATDDAIRAALYFDCPFVHPTVMWRQSTLKPEAMTFDASFYPAEDFELWDRLVPEI